MSTAPAMGKTPEATASLNTKIGKAARSARRMTMSAGEAMHLVKPKSA